MHQTIQTLSKVCKTQNENVLIEAESEKARTDTSHKSLKPTKDVFASTITIPGKMFIPKLCCVPTKLIRLTKI